ncbi:Transcriptional activator FeaR [compost metagenome]
MTASSTLRDAAFDTWLSQVNRACGRFDARVLGPGFHGALWEFQSGVIRLSVVDLAQVHLYRSSKEVDGSDGSHFYAVFQLRGRSHLEQDGNRVVLSRGDISLVDAGRPSDMTYEDDSQQLSLILPRQVVERGLRCAGINCASLIPARTPVAALASRLIGEICRQDAMSMPESEATLDALVSLLRPAIGAPEREGDNQERLFRKAVAFIDEQIGADELCPELIAREVGISVRGLYRMFSKRGLVVAQYIKNRRLDRCAEMLRHAGGGAKLSALGYAWGFSDSSYFSTAFKSRFGISPGEYRKRYAPG